MKKNKRIDIESVKKNAMIFILIGITILFQIITGGLTLKPLNVTNLLLQNSYILILSMGMLILIVLTEIDLSVGSIVAIVGALAGKMIIDWGWPVWLTITLVLVFGMLIGAWQGFWVAKVKVPSFIVTLANMLILRGLTLVILGGKSLAPFPNSFRRISNGFIRDPFPEIFGLKPLTLIIFIIVTIIYNVKQVKEREKKESLAIEVSDKKGFIFKNILVSILIMFFGFLLASYEGIPNIMLILSILALFYSFITTKTTVGRKMYAIGGNDKAAELSGIDTERARFIAFVNMGLLAAISGLAFTARLGAATPQAGVSFELDAVAASYIGGASAGGGIGTVIGALIGGLVMAILNNGMSLMGIGIDWQQTIKGFVLLFAVAFDVYSKSKKE